MKIIIEEPKESEEEQIIFRCREMTPELLQIIARLKAQEGLVANLGTQIHRILSDQLIIPSQPCALNAP